MRKIMSNRRRGRKGTDICITWLYTYVRYTPLFVLYISNINNISIQYSGWTGHTSSLKDDKKINKHRRNISSPQIKTKLNGKKPNVLILPFLSVRNVRTHIHLFPSLSHSFVHSSTHSIFRLN